LQKGRKSANIHARSGVIWGIPVQSVLQGAFIFAKAKQGPEVVRESLAHLRLGIGTIPIFWSIVGTGDFNGDGYSDILWRNSNAGDVAIWFMAGSHLASSAGLGAIPANWSTVGIGDFSGDTYSDILWRNINGGEVAIWFMNGSQYNSAPLATLPSNWSIAQTGDYNGDERADILFRDTGTGEVAVWFLSGTQFLFTTSIATVPSNWVLQDANSD